MTTAARVRRDIFAGILTIQDIIGAYDHKHLAATWSDIYADHGNILTGSEIESRGDGGAVHGIDDQGLGAFLNEGMDICDLPRGIIVGDQWPDEGGFILARELC